MTRIDEQWERRREDIAVLYNIERFDGWITCWSPSHMDENLYQRIKWARENGFIPDETNDVDDYISKARSSYCLGLDYIAPPDVREPGYERYLLATGEPQEEIRLYPSACQSIAASFHFDDESIDISDDDAANALWYYHFIGDQPLPPEGRFRPGHGYIQDATMNEMPAVAPWGSRGVVNRTNGQS